MARQQQVPDVMVEAEDIRYGTALHRVNEVVEDQPLDQESADFLAGDIRDVCRVCDEKSFADIREKIKGRPSGESVNLTLSLVRQLVSAARRPARSDEGTLKASQMPKNNK